MSSSEQERWGPIEGYPYYQVSDMGRIRTLDRVLRSGRGRGERFVKGQYMKTFVSKKTGYMQVALQKKRHSVHRLVAIAFLGNPPSKMHVVNHLNGIPADNRLENLEWTTPSGNLRHAYRVLGVVPSCLGKFSADHPTSKPVMSRCLKTGEVRFYDAALDAVKEHGFDSGSISKCCSGKYKTHKGHEWRMGTSWDDHAY